MTEPGEPNPPQRPFSVAVCQAVVEFISHLVPRDYRHDWKREWQAEIWHSWQFLAHAHIWSGTEKLRLLRRCLGAVPDAIWHFTGQEAVQSRFGESIRSLDLPWRVARSARGFRRGDSRFSSDAKLNPNGDRPELRKADLCLASSFGRRRGPGTSARRGAGVGSWQPPFGRCCAVRNRPS